MNKKRTLCLIFAIILGVGGIFWGFFYHPHTSRHVINLYGGPPEGRYFKIVKYIAQYLQNYFKKRYKFVVNTSEGSVQNIKKLQNGTADIAIVQEDVAYYFHNGGHSILKVDHLKNNRVRGVCFLFWEYLFIFSSEYKSLQKIHDIHVGSLHGGSGVTVINIRDQLQHPWVFHTRTNGLELLKNNKVDALMRLISDDSYIIKGLKKKKVPYTILSLNENEISSITTSYPFYHEAKLKLGRKKPVNTIATRALLAVNKKTPTVIVAALLKLITGQKNYRKFVKNCPEIKNIDMDTDAKPLSKNDQRFSQFPVPMHPLVFEIHWGKNLYLPFFAIAVLLFSLCLIIIFLRRNNNYIRLFRKSRLLNYFGKSIFEAFWGYFLLIFVVLLYLFAAVYLIKYIEIQAFIHNITAKPSQFISMGFSQLCTWVIVFTVTGYEDEIFPLTDFGKIVASTIRLVTIGCVMFIIGRLSADYIKNIMKGTTMEQGYNLKEHIVLCNWSYKGDGIVRELHSPLLRETGMFRPIVVICEGEVKFPDIPEFEDTFCIPGNPTSSWKLRNANIHDSFAIIILAKKNVEKKEDADTHTIMVAMEIAEIVEEKLTSGEITKKPHIAAEIHDTRKAKYLKRAGVDEIISSNDIGVKLLAQTAVTPGITAFMKDILQYSADSNEIYIIPPSKELVEKKAGFQDISQYLLENRNKYHQAILVGIFSAKLKKILINPAPEDFAGLMQDDNLVVMARQRPVF